MARREPAAHLPKQDCVLMSKVPRNGIIGKCPTTDFAAQFPACGHLWHTELLRSGSRIPLGELILWRPEITSDRRLLPARGRGLSACGGQPA